MTVARSPSQCGVGFSRKGAAHAVYYAGLMTGHDEASVRLTISVGGCGLPDGIAIRRWFLEIRPTTDNCAMMVGEPAESMYFKDAVLGRGMNRHEVLS